MAAIHLFIPSHDEIKDFCSMDKKTGRRYGGVYLITFFKLFIHVFLYISYASQCNATLQILSSYTLIKHIRMFAISLKYLYRTNYLHFTTLPIIMCFPNSSVGLHPDAHFCVRIKCIITNNGMRIKYKNPNQFSQCVFSKICSIHFPSWRRYTFLSHLTTKSKISVRWKKWLPLRSVYTTPNNQ